MKGVIAAKRHVIIKINHGTQIGALGAAARTTCPSGKFAKTYHINYSSTLRFS